MTDRLTSSPRQRYLAAADPHALCELASLRLEAVQALIKVLLDEQPPGDASRGPRHTLAAASALLSEAATLYLRALARLHPAQL
jgi:hypothetical protein